MVLGRGNGKQQLLFILVLPTLLTQSVVARWANSNFQNSEAKVPGLLRRFRRFGCWHTCLRDGPKPHYKTNGCEDGGSCKCLVDLMGKLRGFACETTGRYPIGFASSVAGSSVMATQTIEVPSEKLVRTLQCNYKTCWTVGESEDTSKKPLLEKVVNILEGIYYKGKCNCRSANGTWTVSKVHPGALSHLHVKENYKFALNYKIFPDKQGRCVCRFGWQKTPSTSADQTGKEETIDQGTAESSSFEKESRGIRPEEINNFQNDETRHVFQCGLTGCRHFILKSPRGAKIKHEDHTSPKPWYVLELERTRFKPMDWHETATPVVCNLRHCWRVEDGSNKPLPGQVPGNNSDPLRESVQLTKLQTRRLLGQSEHGKPEKQDDGGPLRCTHGLCSWVKKSPGKGDMGTTGDAASLTIHPNGTKDASRRRPDGRNVDEIVPDKDGLCPCHKAYITYYNWKH